MSERITVSCNCEHGGDCSRTTMCTMDSMLQDQADEYDLRIENLESQIKRARNEIERYNPQPDYDIWDCLQEVREILEAGDQ